MATLNADSVIHQLGESAGIVWTLLDQHGPLTLAKLTRESELSRDAVAMAIGWLAREDKLDISDTPRGRLIGLRPTSPP